MTTVLYQLPLLIIPGSGNQFLLSLSSSEDSMSAPYEANNAWACGLRPRLHSRNVVALPAIAPCSCDNVTIPPSDDSTRPARSLRTRSSSAFSCCSRRFVCGESYFRILYRQMATSVGLESHQQPAARRTPTPAVPASTGCSPATCSASAPAAQVSVTQSSIPVRAASPRPKAASPRLTDSSALNGSGKAMLSKPGSGLLKV